MMEKSLLTTMTIGIPAYNEEGNIRALLKNIGLQAEKGFVIGRIIVVSDGSTDNTVAEAQAAGLAHALIIGEKERLGLAARENQLISLCESDILVILNADIELEDVNFLAQLAGPVIAGRADLASCNYSSLPPKSLVAKALDANLLFKNHAFARYRNGQNAYTCHGAARAFSRRLFEKLNFHESVGEDIYSYLFCLQQNMRYEFVASASVKVELPSTAMDYCRQSLRFIQSRKSRYYRYFEKKIVARELRLPMLLLLRSAWLYFLRLPGPVLLYFALYVYSRLYALFSADVPDRWEISVSAKIARNPGSCDAKDVSRWLIGGRRALYGIGRIFDRLDLEPDPLILVFCYHSIGRDAWRYSVNPEMLKRQIGLLLEKFDPVSLADIAGYLAGEKAISRPSFTITFDDGYKDVLASVDLFKDYRINPSVFAMAETDSVDRTELGNGLPFLDSDDLNFLIESGWEIGCHSATHTGFQGLERSAFEREIIESKARLEKAVNRPVEYFSYPKGMYDDAVRAAVKNAGYKLGVTMDDKYITAATDPFLLPRIGIDGTHTLKEFSSLYRYPAMLIRRILRRFA